MKLKVILFGVVSMGLPAVAFAADGPKGGNPIKEVPFTQVHLSDNFWLLESKSTVPSLSRPLSINAKSMVDSIISPLPVD